MFKALHSFLFLKICGLPWFHDKGRIFFPLLSPLSDLSLSLTIAMDYGIEPRVYKEGHIIYAIHKVMRSEFNRFNPNLNSTIWFQSLRSSIYIFAYVLMYEFTCVCECEREGGYLRNFLPWSELLNSWPYNKLCELHLHSNLGST